MGIDASSSHGAEVVLEDELELGVPSAEASHALQRSSFRTLDVHLDQVDRRPTFACEKIVQGRRLHGDRCSTGRDCREITPLRRDWNKVHRTTHIGDRSRDGGHITAAVALDIPLEVAEDMRVWLERIDAAGRTDQSGSKECVVSNVSPQVDNRHLRSDEALHYCGQFSLIQAGNEIPVAGEMRR